MEPTDGPISQRFGEHPEWSHQLGYGHLGVDWAVPVGSDCRSIAPGEVIWADWGSKMPTAMCNEMMFIPGSGNSGICVVVQHDGWRSIKAHLDSTHLNRKDKVGRGTVLGNTGTSGLSTGPHLHGESFLAPSPGVPPFGRYDFLAQIALEDKLAAALSLAPHERWVGPANYVRRAQANRASAEVELVKANSKEAFTGYVIGELVDLGGVRSNIWYVDAKGYLWAGACTTQTVTGLPNLTPAPVESLKPNERRTGKAGAIQRPEPRLGKVVVRQIEGGSKEAFTHWVVGEKVTSGGVTSDLWYKDSIGFVWAGGFTSQSRDGLAQYVPPAPVVVKPPVVVVPPTSPVAPAPSPSLVAELPSITRVAQAAKNKYQVGNKVFPARGIVVHQFNTSTPEENPETNRLTVHIGSLVNTFTVEDARVASVQVAVEGDEAIQFVGLEDRAFHAGPDGNDHWGIEVYGAMDEKTLAKVVQVILDMNKVAGTVLPLYRHNEFMATACGRHVPLEQIREAVLAASPKPPVVVPPTTPHKVSEGALLGALGELTSALTTYIEERK